MTQTYWAIRFYLPFDEENTIQYIGSFEKAGKRYLDDIIVFSGMYGIPDYMLWYVHKDLLSYNFSAYSFNLKLFLDGDSESCYFNENYRVVDVGDDLKSDRKLVYAIQEDYAQLETLLISYEVGTLEYDEKRTVEKLLTDVIENSGIFPVVFCEHKQQELESIKFEYSKFTLDPSWTVRDFIQYVADENGFEWTVKHGILFIGPELYGYEEMKASRPYIDKQVDNISKNYWNMKISWSASPLDVLYSYELQEDIKLTQMRCIWAKHWAGAGGDTTKGCFVPIGKSVNKNSYIESLEGMKEITSAYHYLFKVVKHHQLSLARVTIDEGETDYADEVTLQKNIDEYAKKTPRNVVMNVKDPIYSLPKVGRTTPYLDHNAGLLFPRAKDLEKTPNQLLMAVEDRVEEAVLGPFVMGNGDTTFVIPTKNPDDFRLQFPNGWCLYVDEDGNTIMQTDGMEPGSIPSASTTKTNIKLSKGGTIDINTNDKNVTINQGGIAVSLTGHKHTLITHTHQVAPGPAIPGPPITSTPASSTIQGESDKHSKNFKVEQG